MIPIQSLYRIVKPAFRVGLSVDSRGIVDSLRPTMFLEGLQVENLTSAWPRELLDEVGSKPELASGAVPAGFCGRAG
jgi:hypothetical protein